MQPRGPLMIEHRLIVRMITLIHAEADRIEKENMVHQSFIDVAVDFIQMYADRTHHGKEEGILFRDLARKRLSGDDNRIMNELIQEHGFARAATAELVAATVAYRNGEEPALRVIVRNLRTFGDFYPMHIEKEDRVFFPSAMTYLSESEQQSMLEEFREFDRNMLHAKYVAVIESLEK